MKLKNETKLLIVLLVANLIAAYIVFVWPPVPALPDINVYEDGSFTIAQAAGGCLPLQPCTEPDGSELYFCATWLDSVHDDASWHFTETGVPVADCGNGYWE